MSSHAGRDAAVQVRELKALDAFAAACEPFLQQRELEHVLPLGLLTMLRDDPPAEPPTCDLAVVEHRGQVVAAALRTRPENLVLSTGPPEAVAALADHAADRLQPLAGVIGPAASAAWFADRWRDVTGVSLRTAMAQRVYACSRPGPPAGVPGAARPARADDHATVAAFARAFAAEALGDHDSDGEAFADRALGPRREGGLQLWERDGEPVAMANATRPTPGTMTINAVYTMPAHRNRGIGGALTAVATEAILAAGKHHACLFTDLANPASNRAYTRVGYRPVGDALMLSAPEPR